jgi:hypothetical protein
MAQKPTFNQTVPLPSGRSVKVRFWPGGFLRLEPSGGPYDLRSAYLSGADALLTIVPRGTPDAKRRHGKLSKEEMSEAMAERKLLMSLPISLGNRKVLRIRDYDNGQLVFTLNASPYVIYDCFLAGTENHVITLAPRVLPYPGRQA